MGIILQPLPMAQSYWTDPNSDGVKEWVADPPTGDSWFDADSDADLMANGEEAIYGSDPYRMDSDYDGLTDKDERDLTPLNDPWDYDSDDDGFSDFDEFYEALQGIVPTVNYVSLLTAATPFYSTHDADGDGTQNPFDSDPLNNDRDGDGILNWQDGWMDDPTNGTTPPDTTTDTDSDGIPDYSDAYPNGSYTYNGGEYGGTFIDTDGDSIPDPADSFPHGSYWYGGAEYGGIRPDRDGDDVPDWADNFPDGSFTYEGVEYHAPWLDVDGDGVPFGPDPFPTLPGSHVYGGVVYGGTWQDADSDSIPDWADPFPAGSCWYNAAEYSGSWIDQDNDGIPDPADLFPTLSGSYWYNGTQYGGLWVDTDNDGVPDAADLFPNGSYWYQGTEYAGTWVDADGDWIPDSADPFPNGGSYWYNGTEFAGLWVDSDSDGIPDAADAYPGGSFWYNNTEYSGTWVDSDNDAIPDPADQWPNDAWNDLPRFTYNGFEYLGDGSANRDGDEIPDAADNWPDDPENGLDSDGDGLDNYTERARTHTRPDYIDSDEDYLTDFEEVKIYQTDPTHGNSIDYRSGRMEYDVGRLDYFALPPETRLDSDDDGLPDRIEDYFANLGFGLSKFDPFDASGALDNNGYTNLQDFLNGRHLRQEGCKDYDADHDGLTNVQEDNWQLDKNWNADAVADYDGDGVFNFEEINYGYLQGHPSGYDPRNSNTVVDNTEVAMTTFYMDVDGEYYHFGYRRDGSDFEALFRNMYSRFTENPDNPTEEYGAGYDWSNGMLDRWFVVRDRLQEGDWDADGLPDAWEWRYQFTEKLRDPANASQDTDNDGLTNLAEFEHNTHPRMRDSDGDGFEDGYEVSKAFDPTLASSNPISLMQLRVASVVSLADAYLQVRAANGSVGAREAAWAAMKQEVDAARAELAQLRSELTSPVFTQQVNELTESVENSVEPAESLPSTAVVEVASASSSYNGDVYASVRRDWIWSIDPMTGVAIWSGGEPTNGGMDSSTRRSGGWNVTGQTTEENETLAQAMGRDLTPGTWETTSAEYVFRCDGGYAEDGGISSEPFPPQAPGANLGQLETTYGYTTREETYGASKQNIRLRRSLDGDPNMAFSMSFLVEKTGLGAPIIETKMLTLAAKAVASAGMIVLAAAPGASGDPVSQTAKRIDIVPDSTMFDTAGKARLGDVVPSAKPDSTDRHFVTPKKSTEIPDEHVVLRAQGFTAADFGGTNPKVSWEGGIAGATADTRKVSRDTPDQKTIKLKPTNGTPVVMHVWVVWADGTPLFTGNTGELLYPGKSAILAGYRSEWQVQPEEIYKDPERPALGGERSKGVEVPNHDKKHVVDNTPIGAGAVLKWDVSRQIRIKILNPNLIPKADLTQGPERYFANQPLATDIPEEYPSLGSAEGNDDPTDEGEDNDPYTPGSTGLGTLAQTDGPIFVMRTAAGSPGNTIEDRSHFRDFVRLQIGSRWYVVSDFLPWKVHAKMIKKIENGTAVWRDNGSFFQDNNNDF